mmetsp:Transcript_15479/g.37704  ORF Transcript_15479/g.37704 Transcript_15479/m.37704 type:complete len:158 (+) Transcript_15479:1003-1476(+)
MKEPRAWLSVLLADIMMKRSKLHVDPTIMFASMEEVRLLGNVRRRALLLARHFAGGRSPLALALHTAVSLRDKASILSYFPQVLGPDVSQIKLKAIRILFLILLACFADALPASCSRKDTINAPSGSTSHSSDRCPPCDFIVRTFVSPQTPAQRASQ